MTANLLGTSVADVLDAVLGRDPDVLYVVNPAGRVLQEVVKGVLSADGGVPEVRVVGEEAMLKGVMEDFIVASTTADLVEAGELVIRTVPEDSRTSMFVTAEMVVGLIEAGDQIGGLSTDDPAFTAGVYGTVTDTWDGAKPFTVRTPPLSRITDTLEEELDDHVRADFESVLDALEHARGDGKGLDEVTISLLVAAKNNVLLYDISKWGEDVGIASKATFSRTKSKLEEQGIIDTEKVPIDVGRPRLRLKLDDDRLTGAEADELAEAAVSALVN
ncbi:MAG: transcriptional regulator TbsP [Halodesulfurarchaeum sp.]